MGHTSYIDFEKWPVLKPELLEDTNFELVISVNGKPRKRVNALRGISSEKLEQLAKESVAELIVGQTILKVIVVPDKLVNVVVKS